MTPRAEPRGWFSCRVRTGRRRGLREVGRVAVY
jgi:hypothetical protein